MDANRIQKYFSQKPKTLWTIIAAALIAIGFFFIVILPWSFDAPGMALIFVGAVIFLLINLQIKDSELGEAAKIVLAKFREAFEYEFIYQNTRKLHQAELQGIHHKEPVYESSYLAEGEGLLMRRGSDSKLRTSVYHCVGILMEENYICFGTQNFSLIGGEESKPNLMRADYSELSRVELGKTFPEMRLVCMTVYGVDGDVLMSCQMRADAQTDDLVADINAKIQKHQEV